MRLCLALALLAAPVMAGESPLFQEDCASATVALPSSTTISIGTAWSAKESIWGSNAATVRSEPTRCAASAIVSNVGFAYTVTPVPTGDVYYAEFQWLDLGAATGTETIGMVVNYIDASNHYICTISDDDASAMVVRLVKVQAGVGTLLTSNSVTAGSVPTNDVIRCKIDYTGSPILTFSNVTDSFDYLTFTDITSPLTKTRRAGIQAGANALNQVNAITNVLGFDTFRVIEVRATRSSVTVN